MAERLSRSAVLHGLSLDDTARRRTSAPDRGWSPVFWVGRDVIDDYLTPVRKKVDILPLPLTSISPRGSNWKLSWRKVRTGSEH